MASLRELGENFALILSIYDGRDFIPGATKTNIRLSASLDSRETLESESLVLENESPDFNTELVWTMDRLTFQALRSRKVMLKLVVKESEGRILGSHLFDLKEAIPKLNPNPDESYVTHASWRKLKVADLPVGRNAPSIKAALVVEPNNPMEIEHQDHEQEDQTMAEEELHSQVADTASRISPFLNNEKGYFSLGPLEDSSKDNQMFFFNIFICFARNVQLAFPKDVKVQKTDACTFMYDLFGTQITSKPFKWPEVDQFQSERATAKIFTSPEKLAKLFAERMKNFCIFVAVDKDYLALAEVDLGKSLNLKADDLTAGQLAVFEGIVPLDAVKRVPTDNEMPMRPTRSESAVGGPHIGVRFSVGKHADAGLSVVEPIRDQSSFNQQSEELSSKIWAPLAAKESPPGKHNARKSLDFSQQSANDSQLSTLPAKETSNLLDEPVLKYKFITNLKRIRLTLNKYVECIIKYKYKSFCQTEVTTAPSFNVAASSADEHVDIKRGYCEYNFSAKESAVKKPLEKHPLHLKVYDQDILLGTASVNLGKLYSPDATRTLDSRSCLVQVPILAKNESGGANIIGYIEAQFVLKEISLAAANQILPISSNSAFERVNQPDADPDKAALEVEEWKRKQKEKFKNQLQGLESHHIDLLAKEWERREKERENVVHDKINEILGLEKELKKTIDDNRDKQKALKIRQDELDAREKKLEEREAKLQTLLGNANKRASVDKLQERIKELLKENESLKQEVGQLKAKNETLRQVNQDSVPMKKEVNQLRSQNMELQKTSSSLSEQLVQLTQSRDFYRKASEESDHLVKQLQAEKEKQAVEKMEDIANENSKLKADVERYRSMYETKLLKLASSLSPIDSNRLSKDAMDIDEDDTISNNTPTTIIDSKTKSEILRLKKQREIFMNTNVYKEQDEIIKLIDAKLNTLQKK